jgi:hypothetical protein
MSHFAKVENGTVTEVIVAEQDFINSGAVGNPMDWVQTSYNTRNGVHYGQDGNPDGGTAMRGNYAGIGYVYDSTNDVFYIPQPHPSWTLNTTTWTWEAPTPMPADGKSYVWDEPSSNWKEAPAPVQPAAQ